MTNISATNGTFTNLNNTTIGGSSAAAASFTTINASGNLTGAAASFTTLNASGAASFASTATFTGDVNFNGAVTLGNASGDAITSTGQFTASNGVIATGVAGGNYFRAQDITASQIGLNLQSLNTADIHEGTMIRLADLTGQKNANVGYAIDGASMKRPYGINITTTSPSLISDNTSNLFTASLTDNADEAIRIRALSRNGGTGIPDGGNEHGIALAITANNPSSSFTAVKVSQGRLVWSTRTGDADLADDGAYTVHFINATGAVNLPSDPVVGQIIYIFNVSGGNITNAVFPNANTLNDDESITLIYSGTAWTPIVDTP